MRKSSSESLDSSHPDDHFLLRVRLFQAHQGFVVTGSCASLISSKKLKVTLLGYEWTSTKGGLSTINRELAIQLAKNENVEVSMYLPLFSEEDERAAAGFTVCLLKAKKKPGYDPIEWVASVPEDHHMDIVIGHGFHFGRQVPTIKELHPGCKWIQVVHTDPEELAMFKDYACPTIKGAKKHQAEVELCELADQVVAIGPKLTEAFACYLRSCGKDQDVINLTPGIFSEFANINQAAEERETFRVLVFGRGDSEDFQVKGYDIAACAVAMLNDEERSFKLVFVGARDGEEDKVKERFLKEGISPCQLIVRSAKEREQLSKQFYEADLVMMPSRTEGFGLAALEALSAGLPVLVGGNSGIGKALKKVPNGSYCVVNSVDPKDWAKAIRTICHKAREVRLREAILLRQNYEKTYQWEGQCSALVEKMVEMIKGLDESISFKPGTLSRDDVLHFAYELGSSWKMVGRVLNVPDAVINEIEANESEVFKKCYRTLRYWMERYPSDATYHRLALALQHPTVDRKDVAVKYCGLEFGKDVAAAEHAHSSVPAEIRGRGPEAERAFYKAMETGKVKVYRGRIMLLGQDRAGKTSLKKSLLGLPFDPKEESTVGIEVDRSECKLEVDEVENWMPSKRKKREVSEFEEEIAKFMMRDLTESAATYPNVEEVKITDELEERKHYEEPKLLSDVDEPVTDTEEKSMIVEDGQKAHSDGQKAHSDENDVSNKLQLNINSTALPNDVNDLVPHNATDLLVRYLQRRLEDDIKSKEVILTIWDFAGQHLYYASHSVFLSGRAVYILVYNLNKNLLATAEPCVRQGLNDTLLDNPNNETNLDNLLSWLVSVHSIRSDDTLKKVAYEGTKQSCLRPPVIIVGTNSDQPFEEVDATEKHIKNKILDKEYQGHVIAPFFAVDNKTENDEGVQKLRHKIMEVLKDEPYMGDEVPLRWFNFERAVDALVAKQIYFMDVDKLFSVIREVCHIKAEEEVTTMLNFYHDLGVIVKHGQTVVLQAQWLIDLFKQLITVRPFDETDPLYRKCWRELEVNGILRIALVDHVFSKFIKKGLCKKDILDMMELHGLIAKFSIAADENQGEQRYFVPTQLRSSPSALCEIKPSDCDPCPLILHFLDSFVPHGLFPRLVSKFIHWCSENGLKQPPHLFNNGARLFIGKQIAFDLILICRKRFIKIVLKRRNPSFSKPLSVNASTKMAIEVRNFIERTLDEFSRDLSWLSNLRYELSVVCTHCRQSMCDLHGLTSCCQDDCLHLLRVCPGEKLICRRNCSYETVQVPGWDKWFEVQHSQTKESKEDISEAVGTSSEPETTAQGVEARKRKRGHSSRVPPKRRKKRIKKNETAQPADESVVEDDVLLIAHELGLSWKMVGRVLKVPKAEIDHIEANEPTVSDKCYSVLRRWQEMYPSDATYHRLASALQHPTVGRVDLAVKYCGL